MMKVMIIETTGHSTLVWSEMLRQTHLEVIRVDGADDYLQKGAIWEHLPEIVILSVNDSALGVYERFARRISQLHEIPVIIHSDSRAFEGTRVLMATDTMILKSASIEALREAIREACIAWYRREVPL